MSIRAHNIIFSIVFLAIDIFIGVISAQTQLLDEVQGGAFMLMLLSTLGFAYFAAAAALEDGL